MADTSWLDPTQGATQYAPGAWGAQTPVRGSGLVAPRQPPINQGQQQPQQNPWNAPQGGQQQNAGGGPAGWVPQVGGGQVWYSGGDSVTAGGQQDPYNTGYIGSGQNVVDAYNQGTSTISDFLNGLNGGGGGGLMPNMGGVMPPGMPPITNPSGTTLGGGWEGWNAPGPQTYPGLGGYQVPDLIGGIDMSGLGSYSGPDNTVGLALTSMLMGQVPPPGNEMLPTPGERNYTSGITGGQMDPNQLAEIRASLGGITMPGMPGMSGDQQGALSGIFDQTAGGALANQRNAYDLMSAGKQNELENARMQALADAGLQGQQYGINQELQGLRRYNTSANQDNQLQQSAIQMLMSALGGF
jgi:hypothetical protein